jgi:hypothetical protein
VGQLRFEQGVKEAPSTIIQAPEKLQSPKPQTPRSQVLDLGCWWLGFIWNLVLGFWDFFEAWMLVLGVFPLTPFLPLA